jgi:hypothetical protein
MAGICQTVLQPGLPDHSDVGLYPIPTAAKYYPLLAEFM